MNFGCAPDPRRLQLHHSLGRASRSGIRETLLSTRDCEDADPPTYPGWVVWKTQRPGQTIPTPSGNAPCSMHNPEGFITSTTTLAHESRWGHRDSTELEGGVRTEGIYYFYPHSRASSLQSVGRYEVHQLLILS